MKLFIIATLLVMVSSQGYRPDEPNIDYTHQNYFLPADTDKLLVNPEKPSYICGEPGIHADPDNACQIFHICDEKAIDPGSPENTTMLQYSFVCGEGTFFDQAIQGCNFIEDGTECSSAPAFYHLNNRIGTEEAIHTIEDILGAQENQPNRRGTRLVVQLDRDKEYGNYGSYAEYSF